MSEPIRVVKVGGSLYDLPDLRARLHSLLGTTRTLIVPGGGPLVNALRALDRIHHLGDDACHWLALDAMSVNARLLAELVAPSAVLPRLPGPDDRGTRFVLDPLPFFQDDDRQPGRLPRSWDVTSDSLAVRVAGRAAAAELLLLKSVSWRPAGDWAAAARAGVVDAFFPNALRAVPHLQVRIVNLRSGE
jgi:5-(aminomethyl)-3-furanmethanol phosphate kinase